MAHTKAGGTTKLGRDSQPKYLGVKLFDGQKTKIGSILVRQRGTRIIPGENVRRGNDDTLYAVAEGKVKFTTKKIKRFNNSSRVTKVVSVLKKTKAPVKK